MRGETDNEYTERMLAKADAQRAFATGSKLIYDNRLRDAPVEPKRPEFQSDGNCIKCGIKMYPTKAGRPAGDEPARTYGGKGHCSTCYSQEFKSVNPQRSCPPNCSKCGIGMYPRSSEPEEGKRGHGAHGLCVRCYSNKLKGSK